MEKTTRNEEATAKRLEAYFKATKEECKKN